MWTYAKKCLPRPNVSQQNETQPVQHTKTHIHTCQKKSNTLEPYSEAIVLKKYWDPTRSGRLTDFLDSLSLTPVRSYFNWGITKILNVHKIELVL